MIFGLELQRRSDAQGRLAIGAADRSEGCADCQCYGGDRRRARYRRTLGFSPDQLQGGVLEAPLESSGQKQEEEATTGEEARRLDRAHGSRRGGYAGAGPNHGAQVVGCGYAVDARGVAGNEGPFSRSLTAAKRPELNPARRRVEEPACFLREDKR